MLLTKHLRGWWLNQSEEKFWFNSTFQVLLRCISKMKKLSFVLSASQGSFRLKGKSREGRPISEIKWNGARTGLRGRLAFPQTMIRSGNTPHPQASVGLWKAGQGEKPSSLHLGSMVSTRVPVPPGSGLGFPGTPHTDVSPERDSGSSLPEMSPVPVQMFSETSTLH